ncbi:MAG: GNAT family N-acetyltransferase [Candidatus Promineifilaceae bacterium]
MKADAAIMTARDISTQTMTQADHAAWDKFVRRSPDGLHLHLSGWAAVMHDTYGYPTYYLLARAGGEVCGVLPLFLVPSLITGKRLMTMPGGLCAANERVAQALLANAASLAATTGAGRVVIQDSRDTWDADWQTTSEHVSWLLPLPAGEETLWEQLDGNIRRQVRKARKNGLEAEIDRSGEGLKPFYEMFCRFTHDAGTPVFGYQFLENVIRVFPGQYSIALIRHEDEVIAGYFQLEMGSRMAGMWGAALPETLKLRPAYLALWEIMRDAIECGFTYLDMGRSPAGSNASKFKGQWGGEASPVYQLSWRENGPGGEESITNQVQSDRKFQLFMQLWPRLPLSITNRVGPILRRHIPFA